jgi:hypothetical protein
VIPVGGAPTDVAVGAGLVWVAVPEASEGEGGVETPTAEGA